MLWWSIIIEGLSPLLSSSLIGASPKSFPIIGTFGLQEVIESEEAQTNRRLESHAVET